MIEFTPEGWLGTIQKYAEEAVKFVAAKGEPCWFDFNGARIEVSATDAVGDILAQYDRHCAEASRIYNSPENVEKRRQEAAREEEKRVAAFAVYIEALKKAEETGLREIECLWPNTRKELDAVLDVLESRGHDYGTCVYAVSIAAYSAECYMHSKLGTTGFQAGCVDFDVLRRSRGIKGPFILLKLEDHLYPQYDLHAKLDEMIDTNIEWLQQEAKRKLVQIGDKGHPEVLARLKKLAKD